MVTEEEDQNNHEYAEGYAKGRSSNLLEEFLAHCPIGGCASDDSIYAKGFRAGASDGDDYGTKSADECGSGDTDTSSESCCYVTSACLDDLGLPRSSPEMKVMKILTRNYILKSFSGRRAYLQYGRIAPKIVESIRARSDSKNIWKQVYERLHEMVPTVEQGKYEEGYERYKSLVLGLEAQFAS